MKSLELPLQGSRFLGISILKFQAVWHPQNPSPNTSNQCDGGFLREFYLLEADALGLSQGKGHI